MVAVAPAFFGVFGDDLRYVGRFFALGHRLVNYDLLAVTAVSPEVLALSANIVTYQLVGTGEYVLGRAVVLLQLYDIFGAAAELFLKVKDILDGSTAKTIDALVIITHNAYVAVFL